MSVLGVVKLSPEIITFYDKNNSIRLTRDNDTITIVDGMNLDYIQRALKLGTLTLVSGSLPIDDSTSNGSTQPSDSVNYSQRSDYALKADYAINAGTALEANHSLKSDSATSAIKANEALTLTGLISTITELNFLQNAKSNVQQQIDITNSNMSHITDNLYNKLQVDDIKNSLQLQINSLVSSFVFKPQAATYAAMMTAYPTPVSKWACIVLADENHSNQKTWYSSDGTGWQYQGIWDISVRDYKTNPIDLTSEVKNILPAANIDNLIARKADLTNLATKADLLNKAAADHNHDSVYRRLIDSVKLTDLESTLQNTINSKLNKTIGPEDHIILFGLNGELKDSGKKISDIGGTGGTVDTSNLVTKTDYNSQMGTTTLLTNAKTIKEAINEVFQSGSNVKTEVASAVTSKGVMTDANEVWLNIINNIKKISANSVYNTLSKLNITATPEIPYVKELKLNYTTTVDKLTSTVFKISGISQNTTRIICDFNNSDSTNFITNSNILFDGKARINSAVTTSPQILEALNSIDLTDVENINQITLSGNCKVLISFNEGLTYKAYNTTTGVWDIVDKTDLTAVAANAMSVATINSLNNTKIKLIRNSNKLKFLYYFETVDDYTDQISITVDIKGTYTLADLNNDCFFELLSDGQTIRYTFKQSGTYTINYLNDDIQIMDKMQNNHTLKLNAAINDTTSIRYTNKVIPNDTLFTVAQLKDEQNNVVRDVCTFDNSDASDFEPNNFVIFDGTMKPINTLTSSFDTEISTIYDYAEIDVSQFKKTVGLTLGNSVKVSVIPYPQIIKAIEDINLKGIKCLKNINFISTNVLLMISFDGGKSYYGKKTGTWELIDLSNNADIEAKGMNDALVNSLTEADLEMIRDGKELLRFAYYFNQNSISDLIANDSISITLDIKGYYVLSDTANYSISQIDDNTIKITYKVAGTYSTSWLDK